MPRMLELAVKLVTGLLANTPMSKEELLTAIREIYQTLINLQQGESRPMEVGIRGEESPVITVKEAFGKNKVVCMVCGKEMRALSRHLKAAHGLSPDDYRRRFGIPVDQPLTAKALSSRRRQIAKEGGLAEKMANARTGLKIVSTEAHPMGN